MSAEEFLNLLEHSGAVAPNVITNLRAQIARSKQPISGKQLAKLLVDKGRIDAGQAQQLLTQQAASATTMLYDEPSDLSPIEDDSSLTPMDETTELTPLDESEGLMPIDDGAGLTPLGNDVGGLTPLGGDPMLDPMGGGGLDDWSSMDPMAGGMGMPAPGGAQPAKQPAGFHGKKVQKHWSHRAWPFVGATLLIFLVIALAWLYFVLTAEDAEVLFAEAEKQYDNQSYSEAVVRYQEFVEKFPKHELTSKARVKAALASLRDPVSSKNWDKSLEVAKEQLPTVENETAFGEAARPELQGLLPDIVEGFTQRGLDASDRPAMESAVKLAEEAMELASKSTYIPSSALKNPVIEKRISSLREDIKTIHREINKDIKLQEALAKITEAINGKRTVEAHEIRLELIRQYPSLEGNEKLREKVLDIAGIESQLVELVKVPLAAVTDDRPSSTQSVVMVNHLGQDAKTGQDRVIVVLAEGAVYGVDTTTGRVLWRRFIGYETTIHPRTLGTDAILINGRHNEVVRVNLNDGKLVWRLPVGEPFAEPILAPNRILVATETGKLLDVNPETGESTSHAKFPQPLYVGPGADERVPFIYQPGQHSNLYVMSASDLSCRSVHYLGHKAGTIMVPPVYLQEHLFVAENAGDGYCLLHLLKAPKRSPDLERSRAPVRLRGHIVIPPIVLFGRQVLVITDLGEIHFFEIHPGANEDEGAVVEEVVKFNASTTTSVTSYAFVSEGQLFVAGSGFTKYEIQFAAGKLRRIWRKDPTDTFIGPVDVVGDVAINIRRRLRLPGVSVSAISVETGDPVWRTDIGVPHVGQPIVHEAGDRMISVSALGNLFEVDSAALKAKFLNQPNLRPTATERPMAMLTQLSLGGGRFAFLGLPNHEQPETTTSVIYDPQRSQAPLSVRDLKLPEGQATALPVQFAGGFLTPWNNGQVLLLDPDSGGHKALPFHPSTQPGQVVKWQRPAVTDDGHEFVIVNDKRQMFRVEVKDQPKPHLAQVGKPAELNVDIKSPLVAVGNTVYGVAGKFDQNIVLSYSLPDLQAGKEIQIEGQVIWGPEKVGDVAMLATDANKFVCLAPGGEVRWTAPLEFGPLAGKPLPDGGEFILASQNGRVWRIAGGTGQRVGEPNVAEEAFGSGPIVLNNLLWIHGSDGSLHILPMVARP